MALVLLDRAQESATANTTVSFTLLGAFTGYQSLAGVDNGNTTYYGASDGTEWEVGIGTYSTTGPTLTRTTILSSSNSGSAVSTFSSPITVFIDYPSGKSVYQGGAFQGTIDNTVIGGTTPASGVFTSLNSTSGALNGSIGGTTPASGVFTTLEATGTSSLGTASNNYLQVTGNTTGNAPNLTILGGDGNIAFQINTKGTGATNFYSGSGSYRQLRIDGANLSVNYIQVAGGASGIAPVVSAQGAGTDIPLVLQPKGTGALQAQKTDSLTTGGNARGANAVDWQTSRDTAIKVASGQYSVIGGGNANRSSGYGSAVLAGDFNAATVFDSFVGGGNSNAASGERSAIVGGGVNTSAGYLNFIGGGFTNSGTSGSAVTTQSGTMNATTAVTLSGSNANIKVGQYITGTSIAGDTYVAAISGTALTLSKNASGSSTSTLSFFTPHGVIVGGGNNQATGSYSFIGGGGDAGTAANRNVASGDWSFVGGGSKNTSSGLWSTASGGNINVASGDYSSVLGGLNSTASGYNSQVLGMQGTANAIVSSVFGGRRGATRGINGYTVFSASNIPVADLNGGSQAALLVLGRETTNATATVLTSDTAAASGTNQVILPNNSAYYFKGSVIANVTGAANGASWSFEGSIMRGAGVGTTVLIGTPMINRVGATSGATAWTIALTADTTNGGLAITVTGVAATTIRWVAKIETTEVTF